MTNKKYQIIDQEYINTGGGTMCSTFTIYNHANQTVSYFICNEEGGNLMSVDSLRHDFTDVAPFDSFIIDSIQWSELMEPNPMVKLHDEPLYELYKECHFEYLKEDCEHYGIKVELPVDYLPDYLLKQVHPDYLDWATANNLGIETDGYKLYINEDYEPPKKEETAWLANIKEFIKWWESDDCYNALLSNSIDSITITVDGRSTSVPFTADNWVLFENLLDAIVNQY